jgi:hypothetical protein
MHIDFTYLNKACLKVEFPIPMIDSLVDVASTSELMTLLDFYSRYHQIWMTKDDEPNISFINPNGHIVIFKFLRGLKMLVEASVR